MPAMRPQPLTELQRGRAAEGAEIAASLLSGVRDEMLQRGRAAEGAEMLPR